MYLKEPITETAVNPGDTEISIFGKVAILISSVGIFIIGILPSLVMKFFEKLF
jgi:hypothetical protein